MPADLSIRRGAHRDVGGRAGPETDDLHRTRYLPAEQIYIAQREPIVIADIVIGNSDFSAPHMVRS